MRALPIRGTANHLAPRRCLITQGPPLSGTALWVTLGKQRVSSRHIIAFYIKIDSLSAHLLSMRPLLGSSLPSSTYTPDHRASSVKHYRQISAKAYVRLRLPLGTSNMCYRAELLIVSCSIARHPTPSSLQLCKNYLSCVLQLFSCWCECRLCQLPDLFNQVDIHHANQIITSYIIRCMKMSLLGC